MRTIEFRGKKLDGDWAYGSLLFIKKKSYILDHYVFEKGNPCINEVDPLTVGQFIEELDQDGKMIFEGDILKRPKKSPKIVEWHSTRQYNGWNTAYAGNCSIEGSIDD